jgi:hypothetical protein
MVDFANKVNAAGRLPPIANFTNFPTLGATAQSTMACALSATLQTKFLGSVSKTKFKKKQHTNFEGKSSCMCLLKICGKKLMQRTCSCTRKMYALFFHR